MSTNNKSLVRRHPWRALGILAVATLVWFNVGDRALTATIPGIDPLALLDTQTKPNVLIIVDNSAGMARTLDDAGPVGGDDFWSRLYISKLAVRQALAGLKGPDNKDLVNVGIMSFSPANSGKTLSGQLDGGPLVSVTVPAEYSSITGLAMSTWWTQIATRFATPSVSSTGVLLPFADYDGLSSVAGQSCPATCSGTSCPSNCSIETIKSFNASENGFSSPTTNSRYYIKSRMFRNGTKYTFNTTNTTTTLVGISAITCPTPRPISVVLGDDTATAAPVTQARPCFEIETTGTYAGRARFWFTSGLFTTTDTTCSGQVGSDVAACTADGSTTAANSLKLGIPIPATGVPTGTWTSQLVGIQPNPGDATAPTAGIQDGSPMSVAKALEAAKTHFEGLSKPGNPRNFVILISAFREPYCSTNETADAVANATALYNINAFNRVQTIVVALTSNNATRLSMAEQIAQAGSGGTATSPVRGALKASSPQEVLQAVRQALQLTVYGGEFSDQQSITDSVYELSDYVGATGVSALNPETRYKYRIPMVLQTTFDMPDFAGHLRAWRNADLDNVADPAWVPIMNDLEGGTAFRDPDAAVTLYKRLKSGMGDPAVATNQWTFAELVGASGSAATTPDNIYSSSAKIKRRILTTSRNGVFQPTVTQLMDHTAQGDVVALWPPGLATSTAAAVDPDPVWHGSAISSVPKGRLDTALGLPDYDSATVTSQIDQLQNVYGACQGAGGSTRVDFYNACNPTTITAASLQLKFEACRKEAREQILAYTAGAEVVRDASNNPVRNADWYHKFKLRSWKSGVMAESTMSAPAVVAPPPQSEPAAHVDEYVLYRDGARDSTGKGVNFVDNGLGLRNPDDDGNDDSAADRDLKPLMTVVYHATNSMLHAFRGGPCHGCTDPVTGAAEVGGEELWAFVPFDQLSKLKDRMQPQMRENHTYMLAAPLRFADVWVPGSWSKTDTSTSTTVSGAGVWRTVLLFGRGIGGKYLTALDVTAPGPFTRTSLQTKLPAVLWSRGNPDTTDGKVSSGSNYNRDAGDYTQYLKMGQTWSVPSVAYVLGNKTSRRDPVEFVAYLGSGPGGTSSASNEGQTFYTLDMLTGDIVGYSDITPGDTTYIARNALVASPAAFNREQLAPGSKTMAAHHETTWVYIGDLHGRVWRFKSGDLDGSSGPAAMTTVEFATPGPTQPLGVGPALLSYQDSEDAAETLRPHIYFEGGADNRFTPTDGTPSKMLGYIDLETDTGTKRDLFSFDFPPPFRGTVQPAATYNDDGGIDSIHRKGRVFFVGTRQESTPSNTGCVAGFESILYAVTASTGAAAYTFDSADQRSVVLAGQRVNAVRIAGGQLAIDIGLGGAPPPPPPPPSQPSSGPQVDVQLTGSLNGSTVCQ